MVAVVLVVVAAVVTMVVVALAGVQRWRSTSEQRR